MLLHLAALPAFAALTACSNSASPDAATDAASDAAGALDSDLRNDTSTEGADGSGAPLDGGAEDAVEELDTVDVSAFPEDPPTTLGGDRPALVKRPSDYTRDRAWPAVLLLHGYGASGQTQDLFLGVSTFVDDLGFVLVLPDGTRDSGGSRFWNASDACCNFGNEPVDDVAYLQGLIEELATSHHIDRRRVYAMGHSNGGFMSFGLACRASETFVAIASLAGAAFNDMAACTPANEPVSVLQVHGTADDTILYDGGTLGGRGVEYPSAARSVAQHAALLGCSDQIEALAARDLEVNLPGAESTASRHTGCPDGLAAELWTIEDGAHIPVLNPDGTGQMLEWLLARQRD